MKRSKGLKCSAEVWQLARGAGLKDCFRLVIAAGARPF